MARDKFKEDLRMKYGDGSGGQYGMVGKSLLCIKCEKGGNIKVKITPGHRLALTQSSKFGDENLKMSANRVMTLSKKCHPFIT